MTSLFFRNACSPCSTYGQARLRATSSSILVLAAPGGPHTHFASPRGEKYRVGKALRKRIKTASEPTVIEGSGAARERRADSPSR
ncbi:MAG: hypothetical protein OXH92_17400 [Bryobacterales bacterium]|nr:hypothetical protein [Bryobacterales bacterium]MDE0293532.1 hypothetical protein [Bryobacterales bacterium]MDE0435780.1 hypothetical protein [Bryobacterales bacterium]